MPRVLATAGDPGGAAAILPVMRLLRERSDDVYCLAREPAYSMFGAAGFDPTLCAEAWGDVTGLAGDFVADLHPAIVLASTSMSPGIELATMRQARLRSIPTLCVLDLPTNYIKRFLPPGEPDLCPCDLPEAIAVPDTFTKAEMAANGFPMELLRITGQPVFDEWLAESRSSAWRAIRQKTRRRLRVGQKAKLVVFFSQALDTDYGPKGSPEYRGYDQHSALRVLLEVARRMRQEVVVAVKPHPRERVGAYEQLKDGVEGGMVVVTSLEAKELTAAADLVVSMTSVTLLQAALTGTPVISLQPGLCVGDANVLGRMGIVPPVTDSSLLLAAVESTLVSASSTVQLRLPETWTDGKSSERVLNVIDELFGVQ